MRLIRLMVWSRLELFRVRIKISWMLLFTPLSFPTRGSKPRHKSTDVEHYAALDSRNESQTRKLLVNKGLMIQQRKKKQEREAKYAEPVSRKRRIGDEQRIKEYSLPFRQSLDGGPSSKIDSKTASICISQREKVDCSKVAPSANFIPRSRIKLSLNTDGKKTKEMLTNNFLMRFHNRLQLKEKARDAINQLAKPKTKKKTLTRIHTNTSALVTNMTASVSEHCLEPSLVGLISRFKFQNLKTPYQHSDSQSDTPSQLSLQSPNPTFFAPIGSELPFKRKEKERHKMNKTMIGWAEKAQTKITRNNSGLTPWELDGKDLASTTDIF